MTRPRTSRDLRKNPRRGRRKPAASGYSVILETGLDELPPANEVERPHGQEKPAARGNLVAGFFVCPNTVGHRFFEGIQACNFYLT